MVLYGLMLTVSLFISELFLGESVVLLGKFLKANRQNNFTLYFI